MAMAMCARRDIAQAPQRAARRVPPQMPTPSPIMLRKNAVMIPTFAPSHHPAALPTVETISTNSFLTGLRGM
jgi:hypothetical protein